MLNLLCRYILPIPNLEVFRSCTIMALGKQYIMPYKDRTISIQMLDRNLTRLLLFFIQSCHITNWYGRSEETLDLVILLAQKERFVNFEILCNLTNFYYDFFIGASLPILNQLNDPIDRPVEYRPTQNQVYDPRYEFWILQPKIHFHEIFF